MPVVSFMPYFPDTHINKRFGDFVLWNWHNYKDGYVHDAPIARYLDKYSQIYKRPDGKPEQRITIVGLTSEGSIVKDLTGLKERIGRFASAAMLAHLVTLPIDPDAGLFASSSDNFIAFFQPFEPASEVLALEFGSYFRARWTEMGTDRLNFLTPQFVPDPQGGSRDDDLLMHLASICGNTSNQAERLFRSLDWLRFAFTNATEHPYEARIVSMTTAFEILLEIPEQEKARHVSEMLQRLLPKNQLPVSQRLCGPKKKVVSDTDIGWWCRHFYDLRSRIVHGDKVQRYDRLTNDIDDLKIALYLFDECIWGTLVEIGVVTEQERIAKFWYRQKWIDALKLPPEAFY